MTCLELSAIPMKSGEEKRVHEDETYNISRFPRTKYTSHIEWIGPQPTNRSQLGWWVVWGSDHKTRTISGVDGISPHPG